MIAVETTPIGTQLGYEERLTEPLTSKEPMSEFRIPESVVEAYKTKKPPFGFNGLGELVYLRTYSRIKDNGEQEHWWETVRRVVEGCYSMQKTWITQHELGWDEEKAISSAAEMYDRIFHMKFLPPGRGLWAMGSPLTKERNLFAALNNCAFVSTANLSKDLEEPFTFLMDASMLGIGVGFDTEGAGAFVLQQPTGEQVYAIADTREGWVESLGLLLRSFFLPGQKAVTFDYSLVRPAGMPIKGFGGVASGPAPLIKMHESIRETLTKCVGQPVSVTNIVDIMNMIGQCVVAGNVRRTAEIAFGKSNDIEFLDLKNYEVNGHRAEYGWTSNNSVFAEIGDNYEEAAKRVKLNGEPGFAWLDNMREYSRMGQLPDYKDIRVAGANPCVTADTWVLTDKGPRQVQDLIGSKFAAVVDGRKYETLSNGFWQTGVKPVYRLTTKEGYSVDLTANHLVKRVHTTRNTRTIEWTEAQHLEPGDLVALGNHRSVEWEGDGTFKEGRLLGSLFGEDMVSPVVEKSSSQFTVGFLCGWFDREGRVQDDAQTGPSVILRSVSKPDLLAAQRMLARLGMISAVYAHDDTGFELSISNDNLLAFAERVGFKDPEKEAKLDELLGSYKREVNRERFVATVQSLEPIGEFAVYDVTVDQMHEFDANGLQVHNCVEQSLESYELCCLVETFPANHETLNDYLKTLKYAYLYAKTVTLGKTPWAKTNRVLLRNRRIGLSQSGIQQAVLKLGIETYRTWCEVGYEVVQNYDKVYSEWFAIPRSVKTTSVKPSGSVSLLAGATPGIHWPQAKYYIRRMRLALSSDLLMPLLDAGYEVEPSVDDPNNTVVVSIPVKMENGLRTEASVSMWEQLAMASFMQRYWSDNQVSATITFDPATEGDHIAHALNYYQYQLKGISFLPRLEAGAFPQMPYETIDEERYERMASNLKPLNFVSTHESAVSEKFCDSAGCVI